MIVTPLFCLVTALIQAVRLMDALKTVQKDSRAQSAVRMYLKHVCIAVLSVLHHHRLYSGQRVGNTVLILVTYGLRKQEER